MEIKRDSEGQAHPSVTHTLILGTDTPRSSLEPFLRLDGRTVASLNGHEIELLTVLQHQGRKFGLAVSVLVDKTDPTLSLDLEDATSEEARRQILRRSNSIVSVKLKPESLDVVSPAFPIDTTSSVFTSWPRPATTAEVEALDGRPIKSLTDREMAVFQTFAGDRIAPGLSVYLKCNTTDELNAATTPAQEEEIRKRTHMTVCVEREPGRAFPEATSVIAFPGSLEAQYDIGDLVGYMVYPSEQPYRYVIRISEIFAHKGRVDDVRWLRCRGEILASSDPTDSLIGKISNNWLGDIECKLTEENVDAWLKQPIPEHAFVTPRNSPAGQ